MTEAIWVAIIGLVGVVVVAVIKEFWIDKKAGERQQEKV